MKKIEYVLKQLSDLYEFNKKIQTFHFSQPENKKGQQRAAPDREKHRGLTGKNGDAAGEP